MASPPHNPSSISNSEKLRHTRVLKQQSTHPATRCINRTSDGCTKRYRDCAPAESKIQSRISEKEQTGPEEPSSRQDQVNADIPIKRRNAEFGSSDQGRSTRVADSDARQKLRCFLATLSHCESSIEERLRSLERENAEMLLEVWRSKLEFARLRREIRGKVFAAMMERIMADSQL